MTDCGGFAKRFSVASSWESVPMCTLKSCSLDSRVGLRLQLPVLLIDERQSVFWVLLLGIVTIRLHVIGLVGSYVRLGVGTDISV